MRAFHIKLPRKSLLEVKRLCKFRFFGTFSKAKKVECDQEVEHFFDQFDITIRFSATYFLEVGAHVSLKVATKRSIRRKNTLKV